MAERIPAICQVEELIETTITTYPELQGWTFIIDQSDQFSIEEIELPAMVMRTITTDVDTATQQWEHMHSATIEIEFLTGKELPGVITRRVHSAIAHVNAALEADTTLGGQIHDVRALNTAAPGVNGKDVMATSLQIEAQFFTPHDDWFTLTSI